MFSPTIITPRTSKRDQAKQIDRLRDALNTADAVIVGTGAGLSTSAGFTYSGERFTRYFALWQKRYGVYDMYSAGFYPYATLEEFWGFWSRNILVNRYMDPPKPVYEDLMAQLRGKDYFVLTTNVDHCFQKAGVDKQRLFYTQGDYGLLQCSTPCHTRTYDNEEQMRAMCSAVDEKIANQLVAGVPSGELDLSIPTELVPRCPRCGEPLTTNLRCDDSFVEDEGWHAAASRYADFQRRHAGIRTLYLELGVGGNTPGIIKYPFWQATAKNPQATYACVNFGEACAPSTIEHQSILINGDVGEVLAKLK